MRHQRCRQETQGMLMGQFSCITRQVIRFGNAHPLPDNSIKWDGRNTHHATTTLAVIIRNFAAINIIQRRHTCCARSTTTIQFRHISNPAILILRRLFPRLGQIPLYVSLTNAILGRNAFLIGIQQSICSEKRHPGIVRHHSLALLSRFFRPGLFHVESSNASLPITRLDSLIRGYKFNGITQCIADGTTTLLFVPFLIREEVFFNPIQTPAYSLFPIDNLRRTSHWNTPPINIAKREPAVGSLSLRFDQA